MLNVESLAGDWYKTIYDYLILSHPMWNWEPEQGFGNHFYHKVHKVEQKVHKIILRFNLTLTKARSQSQFFWKCAFLSNWLSHFLK